MENNIIYEELSKQLEMISARLTNIESKLDLQAERDHLHELKIQRLEMSIENLVKEIMDLKVSSHVLKENTNKDLNGLGLKIKALEEQPDKKKVGIVNTIIDRTVNYIISMALAAAAAYIAVHIIN
jgi:chromosome segregation ATPase